MGAHESWGAWLGGGGGGGRMSSRSGAQGNPFPDPHPPHTMLASHTEPPSSLASHPPPPVPKVRLLGAHPHPGAGLADRTAGEQGAWAAALAGAGGRGASLVAWPQPGAAGPSVAAVVGWVEFRV